MAVIPNTQTKADMAAALDIEFVARFQQEYDRFAELIGLFPVETQAAGTALYQYKVTGTLDAPRTRGDDPVSMRLTSRGFACSPHARG